MNTVCPQSRTNLYRKVREIRTEIEEIEAQIEATDDLSVRGPLRARCYVLSLNEEAIMDHLRGVEDIAE